MSPTLFARLGALFFAIWGVFHVYVAWQIYTLALTQNGIAQGRTLQLAAYMLTIALFARGGAVHHAGATSSRRSGVTPQAGLPAVMGLRPIYRRFCCGTSWLGCASAYPRGQS